MKEPPVFLVRNRTGSDIPAGARVALGAVSPESGRPTHIIGVWLPSEEYGGDRLRGTDQGGPPRHALRAIRVGDLGHVQ